VPHWGDETHLGGQEREFRGEGQSGFEDAALTGYEDQGGGINGKERVHTREYQEGCDRKIIKCQQVVSGGTTEFCKARRRSEPDYQDLPFV